MILLFTIGVVLCDMEKSQKANKQSEDVCVCVNSGWGVRISVSFFGNYMTSFLGPKTVVFSKAFGRHTRRTATIASVQRHARWCKNVPVGQAIFVPEAFLLPDT